MSDETPPFVIYGPPVKGRSCGSCKACCTWLPVDLPEGKKPAGVKCRHLFSKGCSIYEHRPTPCEYWSCCWLFHEDTEGLKRPDKGGYIIDSSLDTILADDKPVDVIQVWIDPNRREAHRAPELRAYILHVAEKYGMPAIIRFGSYDGYVLIAPPLSQDNDWMEISSNMRTEAEMTEMLGDKALPWKRQAVNVRK
jgi:hypothetical protein